MKFLENLVFPTLNNEHILVHLPLTEPLLIWFICFSYTNMLNSQELYHLYPLCIDSSCIINLKDAITNDFINFYSWVSEYIRINKICINEIIALVDDLHSKTNHVIFNRSVQTETMNLLRTLDPQVDVILERIKKIESSKSHFKSLSFYEEKYRTNDLAIKKLNRLALKIQAESDHYNDTLWKFTSFSLFSVSCLCGYYFISNYSY